MKLVRISTVRVLHDRVVVLGLTNGATKTVDLAPYLDGPVFEEIAARDEVFRQVHVDPEAGTIAWPGGVDLCPDVLIHDREPAS